MIQLQNLTLRRGAKVLLDGASITIHPGEKVGLVGRNGAGKSTLFALLNGSLHEDGGDFSMPASWQIAQVAQHMPETTESATDFVLSGDERLSRLREQLSEAEQSGDGMLIAHAHSDLHDAGAHDATARAQALILGLGFKVEELHRPVNSFSGGWRMRLQLARALMCPSDLLLLDEPTNHLDMPSKDVLKEAIRAFDGTAVIVSHDREFLDGLVTKVYEFGNKKVREHLGGIYDFLQNKKIENLNELGLSKLKTATIDNSPKEISENKLSYEARKELNKKLRKAEKAVEEAEAIVSALENEIANMQKQLEIPEKASDPEFIMQLQKKQRELEQKMYEWEIFAEELEELQSAQQ